MKMKNEKQVLFAETPKMIETRTLAMAVTEPSIRDMIESFVCSPSRILMDESAKVYLVSDSDVYLNCETSLQMLCIDWN